MSGSNAQATSTLRPRTKRLISGLSDAGGEDSASPAVTPDRRPSPAPSAFDSRSASPIPAAHPQRASPRNGANRYAGNSSWGRRAQVGQQRSASAQTASPFADLWGSSWTTLQGIASDLLGNDPSGAPLKDKQRQKRPLNNFSSARTPSISSAPSHWGRAPTSNPTVVIGTGTREEREAAVRAEKKKRMLIGEDSSSYADTLGKFKRRLSDDHESMSAPPGENDNRDALVYLHHVRKDDTFAGITIRYNCSANTIRKANRMWPNDTVQSRQTLVLPVDACGVKGKPIPDAQALDLLSSEGEDLSAGQAEEVSTPKPPLTNGTGTTHTRTASTSTSTSRRASSSVAASSIETEPQWHHDSWTLLPNNNTPTEIARLSRRALGYFPPARRKSNSYSDLDTPSTSLDLRRASTQDPPAASPMRGDASQRPRRPRRLSNATTGYYPTYLSGPGGVGTMSRSIHSPGPAQDALNKRFAKLLPDVAPPKNQVDLYQPEMPLYHDDPTPLGSGVQTPSYPHGHANLNINLENVGGAIEGWVRRMATKAMTPTERPAVRGPRASVGTPGRGTGGVGDLIEMTDEFEIGGDDDDEDESDGDRGRAGTASYLGNGRGSSGADYFGGAASTAKGRSVSGKAGKAD